MRFSVITPVAGLEKFATLSHTHLLLSYVKNELYWKFYRKLQEQRPTDLIILDNSAYEAKMITDEVVRCVGNLMPNVLVLPDHLGNSADTFTASQVFLKQYRHQLPCDFMYVPQCDGTVEDYWRMLSHVRIMREMYGIKWFGIPRHLATKGIDRAELCLYIKRSFEWGDECYVHALGMANGSLREFEQLDLAQCDSIDSSAPVWRGWNGYGLENREGWDAHGTECDFDAHPNTLTAQNTELILENLKKVGVPHVDE